MIWFRRVLFLAIGLVATAIAFHFWGNFAGAMHNAMDKEAQPVATAPANPGEVTVGIIPATPAHNKTCDKKHPCP
jgi:hypothetical protein